MQAIYRVPAVCQAQGEVFLIYVISALGVIISMFHMGKPRIREINELIQRHIAVKQQKQ